jgi:hypothetical protein
MQCGAYAIELPINAEVSPGVCLEDGQQVAVTFTGFDPGEPLITRHTTPDGSNGEHGNKFASSDGTYQLASSFDIVALTEAYGYGKHVLYVESADKEHFAKVELVVRAP